MSIVINIWLTNKNFIWFYKNQCLFLLLIKYWLTIFQELFLRINFIHFVRDYQTLIDKSKPDYWQTDMSKLCWEINWESLIDSGVCIFGILLFIEICEDSDED